MSKLHSNDNKALFYAILSILFWSTVATAFKITLDYTNAFILLAYSSLFSFIILFIVLIFKNQTKSFFRQTKKEWRNSIVLGLLNPFFYYLVLFNAYNLLLAHEAMILNYSWPLVLTLLSSVIFHRKIGILGYLALFISFFGIIIIATKGNFQSFEFRSTMGFFLALGSSLIWALFWIFNVKDSRNSILKLTSGFFFGTLFSFVLVFILNIQLTIRSEVILGTLYIGAFEMGFTFILWLSALSLTKRTEKVAQLVYLSPFLSLIFIS
ncbi:MAG: hypothetical protein A2X64_11275, partial [Ignavibacteria bacterium GWF2_33_9]